MNTPDRKKLMNDPVENTPQSEKKRQREGMLAQNTSHRDLSEDFKGSTEEDDNKPTPAMYNAARYIQQVKTLGNLNQAQKDLQAINEGTEKEGGGILEMFGLAGGRRHRRKSRRKKRRK